MATFDEIQSRVDATLFETFNIDMAPRPGGHFCSPIDRQDGLWDVRPKRGRRARKNGPAVGVVGDDHAKPHLRVGEPGSEQRMEAYRKFYAEQADTDDTEGFISAFENPEPFGGYA